MNKETYEPNKETYEPVEVEIIEFDAEDVIMTSGDDSNPPYETPDLS